MKSKTEDLIVCKYFKLIRKLGTGAFGEIYLAQNKNNQSQRFAAKLQQTNTKFPQLYFEAKMYKYLTSSGSVPGIPKIYAVTTEGQYNVMLMDLLGSSLEDLFVQHHKSLSIKTVLQVGEQMIERIEFLHQKQVLHRDIKPDNFLMGSGKNAHIVYIVDFGLSKKYIKDGKHIPYKQGKQLTGTARYASINTHMGIEQSRRDDIQSIGYVMMYMLRGILPWQNMKAKDTKTKYKMIMEKKISTPPDILCKGFPGELSQFISYSRDLKFQEKPDYNYLKGLLRDARKKNGIEMDYIYDWSKKQYSEPQYPMKGASLNKPVVPKVEEIKQEEKKHGTSQQFAPKISNKPSSSSKNNNVGRSTNLSKNNVGKTEGTKPNLLETLGQKISGPKISVVKR